MERGEAGPQQQSQLRYNVFLMDHSNLFVLPLDGLGAVLTIVVQIFVLFNIAEEVFKAGV